MPDEPTPEGPDRSIDDITRAAQKKWEYENKEPAQLSLEVALPPILEDRDGELWIVASIKLKGDLSIRKDLNAGDILTIQIGDADGTILCSGTALVGLPQFKYVKAKGAGIIGIERIHSAELGAVEDE